MGFLSKVFIGLDVGSRVMKTAELEFTKAGIAVNSLGIEDCQLPENPAHMDEYRKNLNRTIESIHGKNLPDMVLGISEISVRIMRLLLPLMNKKELAKAVVWEVKKQVPVNID